LIFLMLKHWMVNENIAVVFWNIDSETFIICLWNMWKQLLQHQVGRTKNLKHLAFIISTCITRVWNIYIFSLKHRLSGKLFWNISNSNLKHF
jgi:hypothetical protein